MFRIWGRPNSRVTNRHPDVGVRWWAEDALAALSTPHRGENYLANSS
jgi:hypothetical protein